MKFAEQKSRFGYAISHYSPEGITLTLPAHLASAENEGQRLLQSSFILSDQTLIEAWPGENAGEIDQATARCLLDLAPELVLLGTGDRIQFPPGETLQPLVQAGIGYEIMDTNAACRTYNLLSGEGRQVVAAFIL